MGITFLTQCCKSLPCISENPGKYLKIHGRYIGQNIRLLTDVLEQTSQQDIPGILLLLDFRNPFDTLEWPFIQEILSAFNFGESIKHWVSTFYAKGESSVLNNGFCTEPFPLSRGVRQGCPLSPLLFILGAEILACKIRQDKNIQGIKIYNHEFKIRQFADDTSLLICKDLNLVKNAITLLDTFGRVSGLKLNQSKTKALWLGPWRFSDSKLLGLKWTKIQSEFLVFSSLMMKKETTGKMLLIKSRKWTMGSIFGDLEA